MSKKYSTSNWENSWYGGYDKLIDDLPTLDYPFTVNITPPTHKDLGEWYRKKLLRTFISKTNTYKLTSSLIKNGKEEEISTYFTTKKVYKLDSKQLEKVYESVLKLDVDNLSNLFKKYKDIILNTEISIDLPDKKDKEGDGRDGDKKDDEDKNEARAANELGKITEYKNKYSFYTSSGAPPREVSVSLLDFTKNIRKPEYQLSSKSIDLSKKLQKLLDININPYIIKHDNLKAGLVDSKKIAEVVCANDRIFYRKEQRERLKPFSVVILGDHSGSMRNPVYAKLVKDQITRIKFQEEIILGIYDALSCFTKDIDVYFHGSARFAEGEIVKKIDDNYYTCSLCGGHSSCTIYKVASKDAPLSYHFAEMNSVTLGENYDGEVFEYFNKIYAGKKDNLLIISLSDGVPYGEGYSGENAETKLKKEVEKAKRNGIITAGIGISSKVSHLYNYHLELHEFSDAAKRINKLITKIITTEFVI